MKNSEKGEHLPLDKRLGTRSFGRGHVNLKEKESGRGGHKCAGARDGGGLSECDGEGYSSAKCVK
jgi:hypothetical protein